MIGYFHTRHFIALWVAGGLPPSLLHLSSAEDSGGNAHTSRSSKSTTYSYSMQVCNVCVCMCEHVSACVCIVYTSAY